MWWLGRNGRKRDVVRGAPLQEVNVGLLVGRGGCEDRVADCSYARTTGYLYVGSIFFSPFVGCSDGKLSILWPADSYGRPCGGAGWLCASTGE